MHFRQATLDLLGCSSSSILSSDCISDSSDRALFLSLQVGLRHRVEVDSVAEMPTLHTPDIEPTIRVGLPFGKHSFHDWHRICMVWIPSWTLTIQIVVLIVLPVACLELLTMLDGF